MIIRKKIAVIGSGISGLSAAWLLSKNHDVSLFETKARLGGHSNTRTLILGETPVAVDTGFIIYNEENYPNLKALFDELDVKTAPTDMSFGYSQNSGRYEYCSTGALGILGNIRNITSAKHLRMLLDLKNFFNKAGNQIKGYGLDTTLQDFLLAEGYSKAFLFGHILPMAAAIWSSPVENIAGFPATSFIRFFENHGLLQIRDRPNWRTIVGGSQEYIAKIINDGNITLRLSEEITAVYTLNSELVVCSNSFDPETFDDVVIASHADTALSLLKNANADERETLSKFRYSNNPSVLHSDPMQMPKRKRLWSSWNYISPTSNMEYCNRSAVTYWMNKLQPLNCDQDLFLTVNPTHVIDPELIHYQTIYRHPIFDVAAVQAQDNLWDLQGVNNIWFCGSYFGHGFHEDGLQSGLAVAEQLGGMRRPWASSKAKSRITIKPIKSTVSETVI